jgi:transcriptional regulator GlxA family with amidase domain
MTTRRILFIVYPGIELLDVAGPAAVFSAANEISGQRLYSHKVLSPIAGQIASHSGLMFAAQAIKGFRFKDSDTLLVVGAYESSLVPAMGDGTIRNTLVSAAKRVERYGSICTGAFVLAKAGLLNDRHVATHWAGIEQLARVTTDAVVDAQALYVNDGRLWTSAGVASGIDMALAMLEKDHGAGLKSKVAKQLVVYAHRPGYQSQFSELLTAQAKADERYARLIDWLSGRLDRVTPVSEMAAFVAMSERSFYRHFTQVFGQTPSKFLETLRLETAKNLLEAGLSVNLVSARVGFRSESHFRTAFKAQFGMTPGLFAQMHGT